MCATMYFMTGVLGWAQSRESWMSLPWPTVSFSLIIFAYDLRPLGSASPWGRGFWVGKADATCISIATCWEVHLVKSLFGACVLPLPIKGRFWTCCCVLATCVRGFPDKVASSTTTLPLSWSWGISPNVLPDRVRVIVLVVSYLRWVYPNRNRWLVSSCYGKNRGEFSEDKIPLSSTKW